MYQPADKTVERTVLGVYLKSRLKFGFYEWLFFNTYNWDYKYDGLVLNRLFLFTDFSVLVIIINISVIRMFFFLYTTNYKQLTPESKINLQFSGFSLITIINYAEL